jgi:hypothetical protein
MAAATPVGCLRTNSAVRRIMCRILYRLQSEPSTMEPRGQALGAHRSVSGSRGAIFAATGGAGTGLALGAACISLLLALLHANPIADFVCTTVSLDGRGSR